MVNISKRNEYLDCKEDMEEYLWQHPDRKIALQQVMRIELDCMVGNSKEFGVRHILITQPIDVKLNKDFVDLLERMNRGDEFLIESPVNIEIGAGYCISKK